MELYLLRHGSAEVGGYGKTDIDRSLTEEGEHEVRRVVAAAKLAEAHASLILSSPYLRARQTARIAAELMDYRGPVLSSDALTPDSDPRGVWEEVRTHRSEAGLLLTGHEPLFSGAAAYLLGCEALQLSFPKAGLVRIDIDRFGPEPRGMLRWMIGPALVV